MTGVRQVREERTLSSISPGDMCTSCTRKVLGDKVAIAHLRTIPLQTPLIVSVVPELGLCLGPVYNFE